MQRTVRILLCQASRQWPYAGALVCTVPVASGSTNVNSVVAIAPAFALAGSFAERANSVGGARSAFTGGYAQRASSAAGALSANTGGYAQRASSAAGALSANTGGRAQSALFVPTTPVTLRGAQVLDADTRERSPFSITCALSIPQIPTPYWSLASSIYTSSFRTTAWGLRGRRTSHSQPAVSTQKPSTQRLTGQSTSPGAR